MIFVRSLAPIAGVAANGKQSKPLRTPFEALSKEAQDRLRQLMVELDPLGKMMAKARSRSVEPPVKKNPQPKRRDIRIPKPGDVLSRHYQGREITVRVLESGFEYEDKRYRSLSAIAKAVTGAHWNGLLFFGVVRQER